MSSGFGAMDWSAVPHDYVDGGYVPYTRRTREQREAFGYFHERVARIKTPALGEIPDRCLFADVYRTATAGLTPPRNKQSVGSCVGSATFLLYLYTQACDIVLRGSPEQLFLINPFWAWGYGRRIARMGGPGDGSYGGAQAKASKEFGQVPIDTPGSPQPAKIWLPQGGRSHWHQWTESVEYALSWPSKWPIAEVQIAEVANKLQITGIQRIATTEDLIGAIVAGKPPTLASMFGSRPSVKNGFLVGEWNATWAHQMSIGGFFKHPSLGMLFLIDNQWGPDAHGPLCPFLREQLGMDGSFWISEQTMSRILNNDDAECWVHLDTEDRLAPPIDVWDEIANAA